MKTFFVLLVVGPLSFARADFKDFEKAYPGLSEKYSCISVEGVSVFLDINTKTPGHAYVKATVKREVAGNKMESVVANSIKLGRFDEPNIIAQFPSKGRPTTYYLYYFNPLESVSKVALYDDNHNLGGMVCLNDEMFE